MDKVYEHYEFLRYLTEKRFPDTILGDEAFSFAFEGLAHEDWRRVRAYRGKSSFRSYLGCVWCRLLEDYAIKKFGKITPPQWIKNLGGVWEELFKLLCRSRFSADDAVERIMDAGNHVWTAEALQVTAEEILAKVPKCGQQVGPGQSLDDEGAEPLMETVVTASTANPGELTIQKEKWLALQAMAKCMLKQGEEMAQEETGDTQLATLVGEIRARLKLSTEEQLILTAHFVDGASITDVGKRLKRNTNQIHGQFRRLMERIRKTLPEILAPYVD